MPVGTACGSQFSGPTTPALVCYLLGACGEGEAGLSWTLAQHCQNPGDYDYRALGGEKFSLQRETSLANV